MFKTALSHQTKAEPAMKSIASIISLLLFVSAQNGSAELTKKLIGTWTGKLTVTFNGKTTKATSTSVIKPFQEHGMIYSSSVKISGKPSGKSVVRYFDSGKFSGSVTQGGELLAVEKGTWSISGNALTQKANVSGLAGDYRQTTTFILTSKGKIDTVTKTSTGLRGAGTMKKK